MGQGREGHEERRAERASPSSGRGPSTPGWLTYLPLGIGGLGLALTFLDAGWMDGAWLVFALVFIPSLFPLALVAQVRARREGAGSILFCALTPMTWWTIWRGGPAQENAADVIRIGWAEGDVKRLAGAAAIFGCGLLGTFFAARARAGAPLRGGHAALFLGCWLTAVFTLDGYTVAVGALTACLFPAFAAGPLLRLCTLLAVLSLWRLSRAEER